MGAGRGRQTWLAYSRSSKVPNPEIYPNVDRRLIALGLAKTGVAPHGVRDTPTFSTSWDIDTQHFPSILLGQ